MSEHTYRLVEVVGSSPDGVDQAIRNAVEDAAKTLRNIHWFEVVETRGHVENGKVQHFQVTVKIGFTLDDR
jgi:dodecin